jgi:hypothetical protein
MGGDCDVGALFLLHGAVRRGGNHLAGSHGLHVTLMRSLPAIRCDQHLVRSARIQWAR